MPRGVAAETVPQAETVELVPPPPYDSQETMRDMAEAFSTPTEPATGLGTETVPVAEEGDRPPAEPEFEPAPRQVAASSKPEAEAEAEAEGGAERVPAQYNVPPAHEVTGPASNPRRGWWRR